MSLSNELMDFDATAQAELVRTKEIKPIELVESAISRAEQLNLPLNAIVTPMYDEARKQAAKAPTSAPFAGVPFLLKDLLAAYAGVRMAAGSAFSKD
ncbi:MAG TPA: amidase family protein, partial [Blastocatellia bacterium]